MKSALSIRCQATLNTNEAGFDNLLITPMGEHVCVCVLLAEAVKEPLLRRAQSRDKGRDVLLQAGLAGLRNSLSHTHRQNKSSQPDPHTIMNHTTGQKEWCLNIFVCFFFLFNLFFFPNQECTSFFLSLEVCWRGGRGGGEGNVEEKGAGLRGRRDE